MRGRLATYPLKEFKESWIFDLTPFPLGYMVTSPPLSPSP